MKINFLTGSLVFREHKTGVHIVHENLIKRAINDDTLECTYKISCYDTKKNIGKYGDSYNNKAKVLYSNKIVRFLSYIFPIELFFGRSQIYICDGLIPHTFFPSKKIAIIHDLMVKIYPENYSYVKRQYLNYFFYRCKKADNILAVSETTKKDIVKYLGINEDKIIVMPNGFSFIEKQEFITDNNIQDEYVFYIGDMRKNKNLINAIKAVEIASKEVVNLKFLIAGKKAFEYENLKKYINEHNLHEHIRFLGYITDEEKEIYYKKSKALLFVSEYEGFGIPILEAAAFDTPVITSNVSSMKEIGEGRCVLVDPFAPDDIAKAICSLKESDRRKIIEKQHELLEIYTWDNAYRIFKNCLKSFCKNNS